MTTSGGRRTPHSRTDAASRQASEMHCRFVLSASLKSSSKGLQCGDGNTITGFAVIVNVTRLRQGILRVDYFEDRGFAGLVSQRGEAQALGRQVSRLTQQIKLSARC